MRHAWVIVAMAAVTAMAEPAKDLPTLDNPMSVEYLKKNLRGTQPRLVFDAALRESLREKVKTDPGIRNMYAAVRLNADRILEQPLLKRRMVGRRLLGTSREMLYRINMLGAVYLVEEDVEILARINEELIAVCGFTDWNPSHFLDVAEMSLAVALALDWTAGELPESTVKLARAALVEKGLKPSWPESGKRWERAYGGNNWNQVCNGGLIAAAIAVAEEEPALAARTIHRALDGMPHALVQYAPDGVYPEGSTYWGYGTGYSVMTIAMLESAFGHDFGISGVPGFMESAIFRSLCNAPSGWYYNFADCGDRRSLNGDVTLAWFAARTGNRTFFEKERFLRPVNEMGKLSRIAGAGLAWMVQFEEAAGVTLPAAWKGGGSNPIVIFTGGESDPRRYYFGGKGGRATTSHGNMDAGSFVFELDGVRWVVDPGNQRYNTLEKAGFNLWGRGQDSERWTLLTKNNFGHSTITINNELFRVDGFAPLTDFREGDQPEAVFDLTAVYGKNVKRARRRFVKEGSASLVIEDHIKLSESTMQITWQLITLADVEIVKDGAVLRQDGKTMMLKNLTHPESGVSVISLYPPPLELDKQVKGLKRLEIKIPARSVKNGEITLRIKLSG